MVFVSILTTSRNFVKLISTFLLPVWDSQSPLSQDILVLFALSKLLKLKITVFDIPGTLFWNITRNFTGTFSEYTGNIYWECSMNIPQTYICPVGDVMFG